DLGLCGPIAINSVGQVTGSFIAPNGSSHAFRIAPGGNINDPGTDLGVLPPGTFGSMGLAINGLGQVVGWDGAGAAFRTSPTGLVSDPGSYLGAGIARGINS